LQSEANASQVGMMFYNSTTSEVQYITAAKTFVIDHPLDNSKYLVHGCLEGPEAGVYYRGTGEIKFGVCEITLPTYINALASNFTVHATPISAAVKGTRMYLEVSKVKDGVFFVHGDDGEFNWVVYGTRLDINVEPNKSEIKVQGDGPYKWYQNIVAESAKY